MERNESLVRGPGIEEGLAARVYDPLWLLGRQWQFGEFRHENAASPAWVEVGTEVHRLDEWRSLATDSFTAFDPAQAPLERLVEEHGGGATPRLRLEGGLRWRRLLPHSDDLAAFTARCPFPAASRRGDELVRRRLPDGSALAGCLGRLADPATRTAELDALGPLRSTAEQLTALAQEWLDWFQALVPAVVPESEDAWDEHRLEHSFALRSTGLPSVELRATEYAGGRLDWSSVDAHAVADAGDGEPLRIDRRGVPAPARFGGMPAARFWEMEDARFDPGSIDAAPIDLGRLMLVGYATVYGNDWFVVPLRVPVASLTRVARFDVRDVFGRVSSLTQVDADVDGWNLFGLTAADQPLEPDQERPTSPWFFLAPSLPASLESEPMDSVLLVRDEMANVAWAVEAVVADDAGRPRDRFAEWAARAIPEPVQSDFPLYRVASEVPGHWYPLLPEQLADQESVRLRLVPLTRLRDGVVTETQPVGALLSGPDRWLHEEEVPRSGVQVIRTWQHARWHDGSRHLWQARRKATGSGEGSSGLRWDQVES